ncbi:MFS general substrate transporter [Violaceomyces palustris]|uniref:MFS general substrate transporter n=1 Tax=Violaceomyces palustris TaxID=1673888 RepID=A0ACD0NRR5_9BASI|nr:MFS general substrate transporter [Violaceomyces palustris]
MLGEQGAGDKPGMVSPEKMFSHLSADVQKVLEDPEAQAAWLEEYIPGSEEEKRMVRKIDRNMMPMLWVMYVLNYIDRTNIGNAKVQGLAKDLKLDDNGYSVALLIFFVGYLLFEVPSNMILSRTKPSIYLPAIMFIWGCMTIAVKGVNNGPSLVALRFFLGIVESGFFPGVLFLLSSWYKREELSKRFAIFYSASIISGAFGGLLAGGVIEGMEGLGGVRGWKWLFIIEGLATVVVAVIAVFVLPNYPRSTKWLTPRERAIATKRLMLESPGGLEGKQLSHKAGLMLAVKDWKTWAFTVGYMCIAGAGTISYFIPSIVGQLGYKGRDAQWFSCPPYAVALVFSLATNFHADYRRERAFHATIPITLAGIFCIVQAIHVSPTAGYVLLCFVAAGIWTALPVFLAYVTTVLGDPPEKRAVAIAIVNSLGNFASVYGSFLWPSTTAPKYTQGWSVSAGFCMLAAAICMLIRFKVGPMKVLDNEEAVRRVEEDVQNQEEGSSYAEESRHHASNDMEDNKQAKGEGVIYTTSDSR